MILLASASPRRADILKSHGIEFIVEPADIDEEPLSLEAATDYVVRLAKQKAQNRFPRLEANNCRFVLAADTCVVTAAGRILGKPSSFDEYSAMMQLLSGSAHFVHSAIALMGRETPIETILTTTRVTFRDLDQAEIRSYWQSDEPRDKAGGYGIQGLAAEFVAQIEGSYSNVVGLPILETIGLLNRRGVSSRLHPFS